MKTNKLLLSAAFVAISASGFNSMYAAEADLVELSRMKEACNTLREQLDQVERRIDGNVASLEQIKATEFPVARSYEHLKGTDTEVLLRSIGSSNLDEFVHFVRAELIKKTIDFIDSLQPVNGQFLDYGVDLHGGVMYGPPILVDGTRDSFKMAFIQFIETVHPTVPAPTDARIDSLSNTRSNVVMSFIDPISAFINGLMPMNAQLLDHGVNLHGGGMPLADGTRDSFTQALVDAILQ